MRELNGKTVAASFKEASMPDVAIRPARRRKRKPPFSIRFSDAEMERLKHDAACLTLAAYIRLKLFGEGDQPTKRKLTRKRHAPSVELTMLAQVLSALGQSRLSSNLNQIAKAANIGGLPVTPELEAELLAACTAIKEIRGMLIKAMGIKDQ